MMGMIKQARAFPRSFNKEGMCEPVPGSPIHREGFLEEWTHGTLFHKEFQFGTWPGEPSESVGTLS